MKVATWNVNSVNARLPNVLRWLAESQTDVVLLQETKCVSEAFPYMEIEDAGYNIAVCGQKAYNGVAILSKFPIEDVVLKLSGDESDEQARYIEAVISTHDDVFRVASVYVPNGSEVGSDKFQYKMKFFNRLHDHIKEILEYDEKLVIGGDYNVAPEDIDVYDAEKLRGRIGFHPDEQAKFRSLINLGITDVFRAKHPDKEQYTWWDYRRGGWQNNRGMRLDFLLLSASASDVAEECSVDDSERGKEKASDHAPLWCRFA